MTVDQLIDELIKIKNSSENGGMKKVFYNEDKMNGDLDRRCFHRVFNDDSGVDLI